MVVAVLGGNGPTIPTLDACKTSGKLVIIRSGANQSYGPYSQIPSITLTGLFTPTNQLIPATPLVSTSPFPLAESDEGDLRTTSSASYYTPTTPTPRRQSIVDPNLVSLGTLLRAHVTLKNRHSPCTSVSPRFEYHIYSSHRIISENPPPCNEFYLMEFCSKDVSGGFGMDTMRSRSTCWH
jgi:hypothetical protein